MKGINPYKCKSPRTILGRVPVSEESFDYCREGKIYKRYRRYGVVPISIDCGCCAACKLRAQRQWQARITMEMSATKDEYKPFFFTLTFNNENLPKSDNLEDEKVVYRDLVQKKLFQNLRSDRSHPLKFKYYACLEHGDNNGRPHFHVIMFLSKESVLPPCTIVDYMAHRYTVKIGKKKVFKPRPQTMEEFQLRRFIERFWTYGYVEKVEEADAGSAAYITKYVTKASGAFHRQSLGLGCQWLEKNAEAIAKGNVRLMPAHIHGSKYAIKVPKYYATKYRKEYGTYIMTACKFVDNSVQMCRNKLNVSLDEPAFINSRYSIWSPTDIWYEDCSEDVNPITGEIQGFNNVPIGVSDYTKTEFPTDSFEAGEL